MVLIIFTKIRSNLPSLSLTAKFFFSQLIDYIFYKVKIALDILHNLYFPHMLFAHGHSAKHILHGLSIKHAPYIGVH